MATSHPPPSEYREPNEHAAPLGYASSILNGSTVEGGLRSLTYKSIYAAQLTHELDMAKQAIVGDDSPLSRISEKPVFDRSRLSTLETEIGAIKAAGTQRSTTADEEIVQAHQQLEAELRTKSLSDAFRARVCSLGDPAPRLSAVQTRKIAGLVPVERMEDVAGFDASIYERAAERRAERAKEEKLEQEQEKVRLEQEKLEQARLEQERLEQQSEQFQEPGFADITQESMMLDAPQMYQATGYGMEESEISDTPMATDYSVDTSALGSAGFTPMDPHGSPDMYQ